MRSPEQFSDPTLSRLVARPALAPFRGLRFVHGAFRRCFLLVDALYRLQQPHRAIPACIAGYSSCEQEGWGKNMDQQLMDAARVGDLFLVEQALQNGANANFTTVTDRWGGTPLHIACENGHLDVVRCLLTCHDANLEARDSDGDTPLQIACLHGHLDVVAYLLTSHDANMETTDNDGDTLLHYACWGGNLDVVRYLWTSHDEHANVDVANSEGVTPLHMACKHGKLDVVRYLSTSHDANLEATDNDGWTPLHFACLNGHFAIVRYLLSTQDANLEATDNDGETPLHFACQGMGTLLWSNTFWGRTLQIWRPRTRMERCRFTWPAGAVALMWFDTF